MDTIVRQVSQDIGQRVNANLVGADTLTAIPPVGDAMPEGYTTDKEDLLTIDSLLSKNKKNTEQIAQEVMPFIPNPKRAMWLAMVLPGAGQIDNRKFWKLPIIYGGFVGCIYAWRWNNTMYADYSRAYLDIVDDDPNTKSYEDFLHLGSKITEENKARYTDIFKRRKDFYRRNRDLSIFCTIGVYVLSIIDAYVDASLSQFDISKNLSLRVTPTVIKNNGASNSIDGNGIGMNLGLIF